MSTTTDAVGQLSLLDPDDPVLRRVKRTPDGVLAGYSGRTLEPRRLGLRRWVNLFDTLRVDLHDVEWADIELPARWYKARATAARRPICGFYRYCARERLVGPDPAYPWREWSDGHAGHPAGVGPFP